MTPPSFTIAGSGALDDVPDVPAVYLLRPRQGRTYLGKTGKLRRRLKRLMRVLPGAEADCWLTGSQLESMLTLYEVSREQFPETFRELMRLRFPAYVHIITDNPFPRSHVTTQLGRGVFFGPFRSRASAERFESRFLDLFQLRRCAEDLVVSPDHPGCMYGEMQMCLRPCQQVVGVEEYASETRRVTEFLETAGDSLRGPVELSRDRLSAEMDFEAAAREHRRLDRIDDVLAARDELATELSRLCGVAVLRAATAGAVNLRFVYQGAWQPAVEFRIDGAGDSMDARVRQTLSAVRWESAPPKRAQEHLALLARWFYSTWREGEWVPFDGPRMAPVRKIVRAISRTASVV